MASVTLNIFEKYNENIVTLFYLMKISLLELLRRELDRIEGFKGR